MSNPEQSRPTLNDLFRDHGPGKCNSCQSKDDACVAVSMLFGSMSSIHCRKCLSASEVPGVSQSLYRRWESMGSGQWTH